jgi:hypothetical protein
MARGRSSNSSFIIEESTDDNHHPTMTQMNFSQALPDRSQAIDSAKHTEVEKLAAMEPSARRRIVMDLSRIILFKGLHGEVIDRRKVIAEALGDNKKDKVQAAILKEASDRLRDVFGFSLRRIPSHMEENLPSKYKDRLYLINEVKDDELGSHSLKIHSAHDDSAVEKGVLMIVLALAFCKGSPVRSGSMKGAGKSTRWITEHQLYSLLHRVDENIPAEPPSAEGRKKTNGGGRGRPSLGSNEGLAQTPDVDALLEKFVQVDYLLRDKIDESENGRESDDKVVAYAMGPRSALEIGRRQIVWFCSNILDEQPDPTMLAEIEEDEYSESEEEEGEEEQEEEEEEKPKKRGKR